MAILFKQTGSITDAIDELLLLLDRSVATWNNVASELISAASGCEKLQDNTLRFVDMCRGFITGMVVWSTETARYGIYRMRHVDSSTEIIL